MTMLRWLSALLACFPFFCCPAPEVGEDEFCLQLYWIGPEGETTPVTGLLTWPAVWGEVYAATLRPDAERGCFLETAFPCSVRPFP